MTSGRNAPPSVRRLAYQAAYNVTPYAVLWRGIRCFTLEPIKTEDDLDEYQVSSFVIGNELNFDIRHYCGHPDSTTTVYFPEDSADPELIKHSLKLALDGLRVAETAIAWRYGETFEFGHLPRQPGDRLLEREARLLALKIAAEGDNYQVTTEYVKKRIPEMILLTPKDLQQSLSRPREQLWQQIVGNVISHKASGQSIFTLGLAERTTDGLKVTDAGMSYLKSMGFLKD